MITCTRAREKQLMPWNLPNTLTWTRIAAIPLIVLLFYMPYPWADPAAGLLFAAAGVTDSLDGYFARRLGQSSRLGAFLDPVADKLIVAVALVLLVSRDSHTLIVLTAAVIIGREITISALREWMSEIGERTKVNVAGLGKIKTIMQIVALVVLLYQHDIEEFRGPDGERRYTEVVKTAIRDHRGHNVRRSCLRSGVTICLHAKGH